jgi:plasmid stability protein
VKLCDTVFVKNVTISLDDEIHRAARIRAAEKGTSLSALVKDYLQTLCEPRQETGVRDMAMTFSAQPASLMFDPDLPSGAYGRFADGTPYYTKDGKPRKPGAMRHLYKDWDGDVGDWPDDVQASFDAWNFDDPNLDLLPFDQGVSIPK